MVLWLVVFSILTKRRRKQSSLIYLSVGVLFGLYNQSVFTCSSLVICAKCTYPYYAMDSHVIPLKHCNNV